MAGCPYGLALAAEREVVIRGKSLCPAVGHYIRLYKNNKIFTGHIVKHKERNCAFNKQRVESRVYFHSTKKKLCRKEVYNNDGKVGKYATDVPI